jgi:hypothetical protein
MQSRDAYAVFGEAAGGVEVYQAAIQDRRDLLAHVIHLRKMVWYLGLWARYVGGEMPECFLPDARTIAEVVIATQWAKDHLTAIDGPGADEQ